MKTTELISQLNGLIKEHGDQEICFAADCATDDGCAEVPISGISTCMGDDDKAVRFLICDQSTLEAFIE